MARELTYTAASTTTGMTDTFIPKTSFIVMIVHNGDLASSPMATPPTFETYEVECLPTNLPDGTDGWIRAPGSDLLTGSTKITDVTASPGFKYRIKKGGAEVATGGLEFYWDHITSLRSIYN